MKKWLLIGGSLMALSACQSAPQLFGKAEFSPAHQLSHSGKQGHLIGVSNEGGQMQVYGSIGMQAQYQRGQ